MIGIIFNPLSRMGASTQKIKKFLQLMDASGLEYEYRETRTQGDGFDRALELVKTCDTLVAAGGDGTVYEVVNAVWDMDVNLAILPYGSGNDIARGIYGKDISDEEMIEILKSDKYMKVDCARVNDRYTMLLLSAFGFGAAMLERYIQIGGSYARTIPGLLIRCVTKEYTVKINGKVKMYDTEFITVTNTGAAGGGITIYKDSDLTDGKMELVAVKKKTRIRRMRNFFALALGRLDTQGNIDIIPFEECTIIPKIPELCNFDGELIRFIEMHIVVLKQKLTFKIA